MLILQVQVFLFDLTKPTFKLTKVKQFQLRLWNARFMITGMLASMLNGVLWRQKLMGKCSFDVFAKCEEVLQGQLR